MTARRTTRTLAAAVGLAGAVLPLAGAGMAQAATTDSSATDASGSDATTGYPSTQSPLQGPTAVLATAGNLASSIMDANNDATGNARPEDANGTETQYPSADPHFVEGPVGGALVNGPFE
ncbi:hypothetical protein LQ327_17485 [Actinomycetospora endophytica]|uniref:Uncharacterized protein n=1 Tax=Actinomycetospora endophytica TaxID=2291215 RepID=A0ABS8PAV4_9PSEU|nr:hypothetical protein [Actinomycetospora endophytica]MCD2195163.1 hypothetical protein [Actinomycetospora endophytica]